MSIRRPDEARAIQDAGGYVLWIDADRKIRYDRVFNGNRGRVTDNKSYEQFCAEEDREMNPESDDPFVLNMGGVKEIADIHLKNDFESREAFENDLINRFTL